MTQRSGTSSNPLSVSIRDFPEYETIEDFRERIATFPTRQERVETILDAMTRVVGEFEATVAVASYDELKRR